MTRRSTEEDTTTVQRFEIHVRDGVQFDEDGFTVDPGRVVETLGTVEAPYPHAARQPAETALRALGITWSGYVSGEWTCGWQSSRGIVTLSPVEVAS